MVGKVALFLVRLAVAGIFLVAGVMKIWDFKHGQSATPDFTIAIQHYEILPYPDLAVLLAVYLPWLEVTAAYALFIRPLALGATTAMAGMTTVFLIALGSAWARHLDIACGCFGKDEVSTNYPSLLLRDGLLLIATLALVIAEIRKQRALDKAES